MSSDKQKVDEPLISTDVDRLIRTVAEKEEIALVDLQQMCRIERKMLDKWITVLEEMGYVKVKYALGSTYILWNGLQKPEPAEAQQIEEVNETTYVPS